MNFKAMRHVNKKSYLHRLRFKETNGIICECQGGTETPEHVRDECTLLQRRYGNLNIMFEEQWDNNLPRSMTITEKMDRNSLEAYKRP